MTERVYNLVTMRTHYSRTLYHLRLSERRSGAVTMMINQLLLQELILG